MPSSFPRYWWLPFLGAVGLLLLGLVIGLLLYSNVLMSEAERSRLPVDRGVATLEQLDTAIRFTPDYREAYIQRARKLQSLGRLDEAVADIDKAIELSPQNTALLQLRAELRRQRATTSPTTLP